MGLILDESKENDESYEVDGISFLMAKVAAASVRKNASVVSIDYVEDATGKGFRLFLKASGQPSAVSALQ